MRTLTSMITALTLCALPATALADTISSVQVYGLDGGYDGSVTVKKSNGATQKVHWGGGSCKNARVTDKELELMYDAMKGKRQVTVNTIELGGKTCLHSVEFR